MLLPMGILRISACEYEGKNVEEMRFHTCFEWVKKDDIEADFVSGIPDSGVGMLSDMP